MEIGESKHRFAVVVLALLKLRGVSETICYGNIFSSFAAVIIVKFATADLSAESSAFPNDDGKSYLS